MEKQQNKSIFVFRRDLRLQDNSGLISALRNSESVIPVFIFDEKQIDKKKNKYFSENAFQFMISSLKELNETLKKKDSRILFLEGDYLKEIEDIIKNEKIDAVYLNKDYTPFSRKRDDSILKICQKNNVEFNRVDDYALSKIEDIKTGQGNPYSVFTPFMKKAITNSVVEPQKNNYNNYFKGNTKLKTINISKFDTYQNEKIFVKGGRNEAKKLMKDSSFLRKYKDDRNMPAIKGTSRLSAHLKFGTVSVREVYEWCQKEKGSQTFISELYWRDFYMYISYHFPKVFGKSFQERGDIIKWINNKKDFLAWQKGETGVPIVDAGMRELNETGWMHNRVRMIVASYLTKNLLIDWRWGEEYFAQKLVDYDPSSNNSGWQWSASVGADPKPIRVFNPYTQAQKYDPKAEYIKKWVNELVDIDQKLLVDGKDHNFSEYNSEYPKPLIDQKESFHRAMEAFRKARTL